MEILAFAMYRLSECVFLLTYYLFQLAKFNYFLSVICFAIYLFISRYKSRVCATLSHNSIKIKTKVRQFTQQHLLCGRLIGHITCLVPPSHILACHSKTKMWKNQNWYKCSPRHEYVKFQFSVERLKVKVTRRQKPQKMPHI